MQNIQNLLKSHFLQLCNKLKTFFLFFFYKYSFLNFLNNLLFTVGKKPTRGDHKSDDENHSSLNQIDPKKVNIL